MTNNSSNTVQAFWVAMGSAISYGFILLTSMILSRIFEKGDYGTYRQVMYVYNTLLIVFTLGLPRSYSYFLPRVPLNEARDVINKITYLFFILGIVFSLLLYFGSPFISKFLNNDELEYGLKMFALVPTLMLPTMGVDGILSTFRKSKYITVYKTLSSFFQLVCVVVPVIVFNGNYITAIQGFTVSSFLIFLVALYLKNLPVKNESKEKSQVKYKHIFAFSLPLMYASLWGILMNSADQYFISRYFGKEVFAEFSNGWMDLPFVSMLVGATSIVLMPVFSKIINNNDDFKENIMPLWRNTFEKTAKLVYPILIYCIVFSETIMVTLYGESYSHSGVFFKIRLFMNFFNLIAFAPLLLSIGATRYYAKVIAYAAIATVVLEYSFVNLITTPYTIAVISVICHIATYYFFLKYIARFLNVSLIKLFPIRLMFTIVTITLPLLIFLFYILTFVFTFNNIAILLLSLALFIPSYLVIAKLMNIEYLSIFKPLLHKINFK